MRGVPRRSRFLRRRKAGCTFTPLHSPLPPPFAFSGLTFLPPRSCDDCSTTRSESLSFARARSPPQSGITMAKIQPPPLSSSSSYSPSSPSSSRRPPRTQTPPLLPSSSSLLILEAYLRLNSPGASGRASLPSPLRGNKGGYRNPFEEGAGGGWVENGMRSRSQTPGWGVGRGEGLGWEGELGRD